MAPHPLSKTLQTRQPQETRKTPKPGVSYPTSLAEWKLMVEIILAYITLIYRTRIILLRT